MVVTESMEKTDIEAALRSMRPSKARVHSKKDLRAHIIAVAGEFGFRVFMNTRAQHEDLRVRTRIKFHRKYGRPPSTKMLVIPNCLVGRLLAIYRCWPELGEFLLRTALWHEYQHLQQDPTNARDMAQLEEDANRLMVEKMGLPGLIVCLWYFTSYTKLSRWDRLLNRKRSLEVNGAQEEIVDCLHCTYPRLVPANEQDEVLEGVLWLEREYRRRHDRHDSRRGRIRPVDNLRRWIKILAQASINGRRFRLRSIVFARLR